jgi:hypothetical protein
MTAGQGGDVVSAGFRRIPLRLNTTRTKPIPATMPRRKLDHTGVIYAPIPVDASGGVLSSRPGSSRRQTGLEERVRVRGRGALTTPARLEGAVGLHLQVDELWHVLLDHCHHL